MCFGGGIYTLLSGARRSFLVLSAAGHARGRLYTMAQVWVPGGFRGACSGRSKLQYLVSNRGVAFRGAATEQGKPACQLFCSDKPRQDNTRFKLSPFLQRRTLLPCVCGHLRMHVCAAYA